jgi:hypothetical protein
VTRIFLVQNSRAAEEISGREETTPTQIRGDCDQSAGIAPAKAFVFQVALTGALSLGFRATRRSHDFRF